MIFLTLALVVILVIAGCGRGRGMRDGLPAPPAAAPEAKIRLNPSSGDVKAAIEVIHLKPDDLAKLAKAGMERDQWVALLGVYVEDGIPANQTNRPALLGSYRVVNQVLRFEPRFPLQPGLRYRAVFDFSHLPDPVNSKKPLIAEFTLPKAQPSASTVVEQVYPSTGKLPENQLKFYIHFSAPMSRGETYQHVHLLSASGKEIDLPFLELAEELWDAPHRRFTLFFDPGRIKRGLKPREEVGPVLEEGKTYTFVIDRNWTDAQGNQLKESYKKIFQVGPPDDQPPDPKSWRIQPPSAGGTEPLVLSFPKPMDHAMLHRVIWVTTAGEKKVAGTVTVTAEETRWQFKPQETWAAGNYQLVAEKTLEDLAGNSIGRPFELDVLHPIERTVESEKISIPFRVKKAPSK